MKKLPGLILGIVFIVILILSIWAQIYSTKERAKSFTIFIDPLETNLDMRITNPLNQTLGLGFNYYFKNISSVEECTLLVNGDAKTTEKPRKNPATDNYYFFEYEVSTLEEGEQRYNWHVICIDSEGRERSSKLGKVTLNIERS